MPILSIDEIFDKDYDETYQGSRSLTRNFVVEVSPGSAGPPGPLEIKQEFFTRYQIQVYPDASNYYYGNEADPLLWCASINYKQDSDNAKFWKIIVKYEGLELFGSSTAPINMPWKVDWSFTNAQRPLLYYVDPTNGVTPVLNTAYDAYDPPPTVDDSRAVLKITRNEASFDWVTAYNYRDTTNLNTFFGAGPNFAKCQNISGSREYHARYGYFWVVTFDFLFTNSKIDPQGWQKTVLDQGYNEIVDGAKRKITLNGIPVSSPANLSGGQYAGDGAPPDVLYIPYYQQVDFGVFNLEPIR